MRWLGGLALVGACMAAPESTDETTSDESVDSEATTGATSSTGSTDTGVPTEGLQLREPRLPVPTTYCVTPSFEAAYGLEEAQIVVAVWDDLAPKNTLFAFEEDCADAHLEFDQDDEFAGLAGALVFGTTPVRAELIASDDGFLVSAAEVEKDGCPSDLHLQLNRLLAHELGHVIGLPNSCESGDPCEDPEARAALMYTSTPLSCTPPATSAWDQAALETLLATP